MAALEMDVFRTELQSFPLRAFIDEARDLLGNEVLSEVLSHYSVQLDELMDTSTWVSLEFVESILQEFLDRSKDPQFFDRATVRGLTPKYVGPLYPLLVSF